MTVKITFNSIQSELTTIDSKSLRVYLPNYVTTNLLLQPIATDSNQIIIEMVHGLIDVQHSQEYERCKKIITLIQQSTSQRPCDILAFEKSKVTGKCWEATTDNDGIFTGLVFIKDLFDFLWNKQELHCCSLFMMSNNIGNVCKTFSNNHYRNIYLKLYLNGTSYIRSIESKSLFGHLLNSVIELTDSSLPSSTAAGTHNQ